MKRLLLTSGLLLFLTNLSFSQSWERLFSKQSTDVFRCVQEVSTGGYVAAGYTADSTVNDSDAFVVRLNPNGDTLWTYTYNSGSRKKDLFYKIIETSDGGFLALGYTNSFPVVSDDILYIKLSSSGTEQWVKTWGSAETEHGQDVVETIDGYTLCGYTTTPANYYQAVIIHVDFNGDVLWTNTIGDTDYDDANAIELLSDGGYLLGGQGRSNGNFDMYLIRTNSLGDTLWTKHVGSAGIDNIESMTKVTDGYILAGGTTGATSGNDGYIVKVDTGGNMVWSKIYGGDDQDDFHRIEPTTDGGFILCGTTASYGPAEPNIWLFKADSNGDSLWAYTYGDYQHDHGYSAVQTSDGGYILAGHTGSYGYRNEDAYVVKTDSNGIPPRVMKYVRAFELNSPSCTGGVMQDVKVLVRNFGHTDENNVQLTVDLTGSVTQTLNATIPSLPAQTFQIVTLSPQVTTTGTITFTGYTNVVNDVYPQLNSFTQTITPCTGIDDIYSIEFSVYPNPASGLIHIQLPEPDDESEITLLNSNGAVVKRIFTDNLPTDVRIDAGEFANGIYLIKVVTKKGMGLRKVLFEK